MLSKGADGNIDPLFSGKRTITKNNETNVFFDSNTFFTTKMIVMKIKKNSLDNLYIVLSIILNLFLFFTTYINFSSHRGTDFGLYSSFLNYYLFGENAFMQAQGVGYFYLVSLITSINKNALLISIDYKNLIYNYGIQLTNYILFVLGLFGIYKILRSFNLSKIKIFTIINLVTIFPPLIGLRMIMKPEVLGFTFLPWILYFLIQFKDKNQTRYLLFSLPMIALLISSKASIALMVIITLVIFLGKDVLKKNLVITGSLCILLTSLLIYESYTITNLFVWEHKTPKGYNYKATIDFLYRINFNIWETPFRDTQSNSFLGILFLDTFGDYWERYWAHSDGYIRNNQKTDNFIKIIGLVASIFFYCSSLYFLFKEKNKTLKKLGSLGFIGILVLLIGAFNLIPFLSKNFNPYKGDPIKTHYFSFLLVFTFIYLILKIFINKKEVFLFLILIFSLSYSFQLLNPLNYEYIKSDQTILNKIHLLSPCFLGDPANIVIGYSHNWCDQNKIAESICMGDYDESLVPIQKDGYLIFPVDESYKLLNLTNDNNSVTVNNYYECLNYTKGGFIPQESEKYFRPTNTKKPVLFSLLFFISSLIVFYNLIILRSENYEIKY